MNNIIVYITTKAIPLAVGFTIKGLITFTFFNTIYVILNTIKTNTSVKAKANDAKAKRTSSILSTITYAYYTIILKMVAQNNILESFFGTGISNYFGNYIGIGLSKKVIKRNWRHCIINVSRQKYTKEQIIALDVELKDKGLKLNVAEKFQFKTGTLEREKEYFEYKVFSKSDAQDKILENIIKEHNLCRTDWVEGGPIKEES